MTSSTTASSGKFFGIPRIGFCAEKHHLLSRFLAAVKEIADLHQQQTHAVIDGDPDFIRFDALLHRAGQRKDLAKYTLMSHSCAHGC